MWQLAVLGLTAVCADPSGGHPGRVQARAAEVSWCQVVCLNVWVFCRSHISLFANVTAVDMSAVAEIGVGKQRRAFRACTLQHTVWHGMLSQGLCECFCARSMYGSPQPEIQATVLCSVVWPILFAGSTITVRCHTPPGPSKANCTGRPARPSCTLCCAPQQAL